VLEKRIISSIGLIVLIITAIFNEFVFIASILLFIAVGMNEFFNMLRKKGIKVYSYFGAVIGLIIPLSIVLHYRYNFAITKKIEFVLIIAALLFLLVLQFKRREHKDVIIDISTTVFGVIYVSWLFSFLIKIRYMPEGAGLFAAVLIMTKLGDIGAYIVGMTLGKNPLLPKISPKKTVEGAIGGLFFSMLGAVISKNWLGMPYLHAVLLGLFLGVLGQLGDLSESLIKRDCGVKDSGSVLPGMGGFLDEMDSLLFTAPVFYFYLSVIL